MQASGAWAAPVHAGVFRVQVVAWLPAGLDADSLWLVVYSDGDKEEMMLDELRSCFLEPVCVLCVSWSRARDARPS